jgi:hypothetical protein
MWSSVLPLEQWRNDMSRITPINYRGFSIEQETDGTFSVYRFGYIRGGLKTVEAAKADIDWRVS